MCNFTLTLHLAIVGAQLCAHEVEELTLFKSTSHLYCVEPLYVERILMVFELGRQLVCIYAS